MHQIRMITAQLKDVRRYRALGIGGLCMVAIVLASISYTNGVVRAWCSEDAGLNDRCVAENYRDVVGGRVDESTYRSMVDECMTGNPTGLDFGTAIEGSCANAAALCLQRSISQDKCTADNMATIAFWCNSGRGVDGRNSCDKLSEMNRATVQEASDAADKKAAENCVTSGDSVQQFDQREACKKAVQDACEKPYDTNGTVNSNKKYNEYGYEEYQKCLNDAYYETAKSPEECRNRGGTWGTFQGQTGNDTGVCNPPANDGDEDGDGVPDDQDDDPAKAPNVNSGSSVDGKCGEARVNLLACEGSGTSAINDVLRIVVVVITTGIGVAAVGGLAYASILYAGAQDNAGNVSQARDLIRNIVIGLLLYGFLVAIINWLVPGGVIG